MKKFLLLGLMFVLSLQVACTREDRTEAGGEPVLTDSEMEQRIDDSIQADPSMKGANLSVDADTQRDMVTLSGTVDSETQKDRAMELAQNIRPSLTVNDQIRVERREVSRSEYTDELASEQRRKATSWGDKVGGSLDDAWIHAKITTKLVGDSDTPAHRINVDVDRNVVTLRGTVASAEERSEAERLAKETEGVTRVVNQLKVSSGS